MNAEGAQFSVPFDRRGLLPLAVGAVILIGAGAAMLVDDVLFVGLPLPAPLRIGTALGVVLLGAWFAWAALCRARSADPALELRDGQLHLHVNPGRNLALRMDQVLGVGPVEPVRQAARRWALGAATFEIRTAMPEGLRASSVIVSSRSVVGDLSAVRDQLADALRSTPDPGPG